MHECTFKLRVGTIPSDPQMGFKHSDPLWAVRDISWSLSYVIMVTYNCQLQN